MRLFTFLLDCLLPPRSLRGQLGELVTWDERTSLHLDPICLQGALLKKPGLCHLDRIIAAGMYAESRDLRAAIHALKYGRRTLLVPLLSELLLSALKRFTIRGAPTLCAVPLHWTRKWTRGFNQSELLALELHRKIGWPIASLLTRIRSTGSQARRERGERSLGVKDAFRVRSAVPPFVLLVDDLCTTGSTLGECGRILKLSGARTVEALVLALSSS